MTKNSGPPELYREYVDESEVEVIRRFSASLGVELVRDFPPNNRPVRRRFHTKHHGCVHAEFRVDGDLAEDFRYGVFARRRTFPALIRFSNCFRELQHDKNKDGRGMAIKLLSVEGKKVMEDEIDATTQDFLLLNNPVSFFRTAADFEDFSNAVDRIGPLTGPLHHFFGWNPFRWKVHEALSLSKSVSRPIRNPLAERYWSGTPYRMGPKAIKFTAIPRLDGDYVVNDMKEPSYLYRAMAEQLRHGSVNFDFMAQLQIDPVKMPIEDATINWDEKLSPFQKVADIYIPAQNFDAAHLMEFCEQLSFTSWHTLPEHMPLGCINRLRKATYQALSKARHAMNEAPRVEPTIETLPEAWRTSLAPLERKAG